ncbi:NAD-dependent epimerase/dehydratase family protein [Actinoplanes oblitus]|uniref:NAD-dependent epimerase/dehydratase family protein n=1 Tax=Actinoplanes oblitus TaxID=3040509 RepID=A0ABY8WCA3_9ACTN|nr:NAD-dependent epimerase/dehydratase family protein [Actinoplanes oblitus]WIM93330.1 NAD-dependent epimerase/dehydratase family protein [Actinoplanes oblitus]
MRIVVTGASGNIGTALLGWLAARPEITAIAGIARRVPPAGAGPPYDRVSWHPVDVAGPAAAGELAGIFRGAAAVVHLAWHIVGGHDRRAQARTNRVGSAAVLAACLTAGVPHLVHLSSAAVYSPRTGDLAVPESWPRRGCERSAYSRDKVAVEDLLDRVRAERRDLRITRIRPPAVLQPAAAGDLARLALGRLAPLAEPLGARAVVLPLPGSATLQVVAAADVADLIGRAVLARAAGAFNVAGEPVLSARVLARLLGGRHLPTPRAVVRGLLGAAWWLRVQPLDASWADLLLDTPLLDCARAGVELGWRPRHDARLTVVATRRAIAGGAGTASPRLRRAGG